MKLWIPTALRVAPPLDERLTPEPPTPRTALLINPFYPKDPHASFGKHVLEQLAEGYSWSYQRLFSHRSIWLRRPRDVRAVLPYLAMSYLYKRSNRFWHLLIRSQQTARVWRPLVESTRRRHVRFRRRLERTPLAAGSAAHVVSAGV